MSRNTLQNVKDKFILHYSYFFKFQNTLLQKLNLGLKQSDIYVGY